MAVEVHLLPFTFPNFLRVQEWADEGHTYPVAHLSQEQAAAYWDELKGEWLKHVRRRSEMAESDMRQLRLAQGKTEVQK